MTEGDDVVNTNAEKFPAGFSGKQFAYLLCGRMVRVKMLNRKGSDPVYGNSLAFRRKLELSFGKAFYVTVSGDYHSNSKPFAK